MGSTPEGRIQAKIQKALREDGVFVFKVHGSALMPKGLPDLVCCVEGEFVGLEVKTPQTLRNVSPHQLLKRDEISAAGGRWFVVASVDDALDAIEQVRASRIKRPTKRAHRE